MNCNLSISSSSFFLLKDKHVKINTFNNSPCLLILRRIKGLIRHSQPSNCSEEDVLINHSDQDILMAHAPEPLKMTTVQSLSTSTKKKKENVKSRKSRKSRTFPSQKVKNVEFSIVDISAPGRPRAIPSSFLNALYRSVWSQLPPYQISA